MNGDDAQLKKQFLTIRIIAVVMLIVAPLIYLNVARRQSAFVEPNAGGEMMFYILFGVALISPATAFVVERYHLASYLKTKPETDMKPINLFFTLSLIRMAMCEAVFIYGFIVTLLTGDFSKIYIFYVTGVIWFLVHWPRRARYDQLVERLSRP